MKKCDICHAEEAVYKARNYCTLDGYYLLCTDCMVDGLDMAKFSILDVNSLEEKNHEYTTTL